MATLVLSLDARSSKEEKNIRIRINHNCTSSYYNTGITCVQACFTGDLDAPVSRLDVSHKYKNNALAEIISKVHSVISDFTETGEIEYCSANDIRDVVSGKRNGKDTPFVTLLLQYGEQMKEKNTANTFTYSYKVLNEYMEYAGIKKEANTLRINYQFLRGLERWMEDHRNLSSSTRSIVFRNMRTVYNEAIKCNIASVSNYPFRMFKIKKARPKSKEYLHEEDFTTFMSLDFRNLQGVNSLELVRDIWKIQFLLCGMNVLDIYELPKMRGNEIVRVRSKEEHCGADPVRIRVTPELKELIDKYSGQTHLFYFCEKWKNYDNFQSMINHRIRRISEMVGVSVTYAVCRHTWATYASKLRIDKYVISKSLGHIERDVTEENYICYYDWDRTNEANEMVIKYAFKDVKENSIPTKAFIREYKK